SKLTALIGDCVDQIEDEMRLHLAASSHSQEDGSQSLLHLREHSTPKDTSTAHPTHGANDVQAGTSPSGGRPRNNTRTTAASDDEFGHSDLSSKVLCSSENQGFCLMHLSGT